ncbi:MAG: sigma-70 family RNA polymerase sigma factor [Candidatus Solibacter sp.]
MTQTERKRIFEELFQRHKAPLERLCFAYLNSAGEVEDLFQEIMSNVWNALPKFRGEAQAGTWLYRIAVNTALLHRRKWRPSEALPEMVDPAAGAHQTMEDRERLAALHRAIAVLPDQERLVITLLLEGLSYKEIAEVTGLTVNHVGVKISRIKQAIEQRLTEECHGRI